MVSTYAIGMMVLELLLAVGTPIFLYILFRRRGARRLPFFVGMAVMFLFALVLEAMVHRLVLFSAAGATIQASPWMYAVYGGLMAALFEETGRYLAFRTVLRKDLGDVNNALMYGAGHGGIESILVVGVTVIGNLILSGLINSGNIAALTGTLAGGELAEVQRQIDTLIATQPPEFLVGGLERLMAIASHLGFSVLVFLSVKKKRVSLLFLAMLLHAGLDGITVYAMRMGVSIYLVELLVMVFAGIIVLTARTCYRKEEMEA